MLTQFFNRINWVDVILAILFVRIIFISVKNGVIAEIFKFLAVLSALFISLHYYAYLAEFMAKKNTLSVESWQFLFFIGIGGLIVLAFKFLREGIMLLFKVEAVHQGFDKYAGGFVGVFRAILLISLVIFALMLMRHEYIYRQTASSVAYKIAAKAAPNTYSFLYRNLFGKLFEGAAFNADVFAVVGSHGIDPK